MKMPEIVKVYVFRSLGGAAFKAETVVCAAPVDAVVAIYGGGGVRQTDGLSAVFGGCALYRQGLPARGEHHLAVWGERKASRFRQSFRDAGMDVEIVRARPPGRLVWFQTR